MCTLETNVRKGRLCTPHSSVFGWAIMTICSNRSWCVRGVKGFVEISGVGTARELVLVVGTGVDSGVGVTCGRSTEVGEFVVEVRTSAGVSRFLLEVRQTSQTGKTCSRNPIRALKVIPTKNDWAPRMDRESKKLHIRSKISERAGLTRQPSLLQGPVIRHRFH
jgi:hypothetical protein